MDPPTYTATQLGEVFTINVNITNVDRMGAFQFKLGYNTTLLDAVWCTLTPISQQYSTSLMPTPWNETNGIVDDQGYVVFGAGWPDDINNPFSGSGALLTINFTATVLGSCTLDIYDTDLMYLGPYPDYDTYPIDPYDVEPGSVTVIPEFPASIVTPLLLIATLAAAFLGKMVWSRKRKDALIAE